MSPMEIEFIRRVAESSPLIVVLLSGVGWLLWKKLDAKDKALLDLQKETLTALHGLTSAIDAMRTALSPRSRDHKE